MSVAVINRDSIRAKVDKGSILQLRCTICGRPVEVSGDDWDVVYRGRLRCVICKECRKK